MEDKREIPAVINEKISDLVHDFMNFNALKIHKKIHKKTKNVFANKNKASQKVRCFIV